MSEARFGPYRIVETLGSGALSAVYKAVQEPLGRTVALKSLKTQIAPTSSFGEQLEREAKILADLLHPNIVLLVDQARSAGGRPYLVLEYVDGPSLAKVLSKRKKLSIEAALAIARQICAALELAHGRGVVHRDVKPSNVLIGRAGVVKVIDFGIAQRVRTASISDAEQITPSGRLARERGEDAFGTPAYMSPEQILGDFVDGRSDLFSLGVVLYQMLSGTRPLEAPGEDGAPPAGDREARRDPRRGEARRSSQRPPAPRDPRRGVRRDTPAPLRERAPDVPRAVERIVMRLLERSPLDRYASAAALGERLERALGAITRDDPASIVRAALAEAGFLPRDKRPSVHDEESRQASSLRLALAGQLAVLALFALAVAVALGTSAAARDAGKVGAQPLELVPDRPGGLRVVATPWAHVKVDGQDVETTPFARTIPLSAGRHFVTLMHPDSRAVEREVTIMAGETVMLDVTMPIDELDAGSGRDAR